MDAYAEFPLTEESAITAEAAYYVYDKGTEADPESKAYYVQAATLLPGKLGPGKLQPVIKIEKIDQDGANNNTTSWAGGVNYYIKEHNAKLMAEYLSVSNQENADTFSGSAGKDRSAFTVVLSFGI